MLVPKCTAGSLLKEAYEKQEQLHSTLRDQGVIKTDRSVSIKGAYI